MGGVVVRLARRGRLRGARLEPALGRAARRGARRERHRRLRAAADRRRPKASSTRARSRRCRAAAYLINVARGAHVVEADLIAAVRSRPSRAAPRSTCSAASRCPPTIRSGRCPASRSRRTSRRSRRPRRSPTQFVAGAARACSAASALPNAVDRARGYSRRQRALAARRRSGQTPCGRLQRLHAVDRAAPSASARRRRRAGCRAPPRARRARRATAPCRTPRGRRPACRRCATIWSPGCRPAASAGLSALTRTTRTWPSCSTQLRPSQARWLLRDGAARAQLGEDRLAAGRSARTCCRAARGWPSPSASVTISEPMPTSSPSALNRPRRCGRCAAAR